jgi:hypothetical protein
VKSRLAKALSLLLVAQLAAGPLARADQATAPPDLSRKMSEWISVIREDPEHRNVLWVLKEMDHFAGGPDSGQIRGAIGDRFRELRKDMLQASAFQQRLAECSGEEKHAKAAAEDLTLRYVLRTVENPKDCIVCGAKTPDEKEFVDRMGRPFVSSPVMGELSNRNLYSVSEVMERTNRQFGFGDPAREKSEQEDAIELMSRSVLETQKNVLRNYIYFSEHFDVGDPKPRRGEDYVHALFFSCYDPITGARAVPLIGCSPESFSDSENELTSFAERELARVHTTFGAPKKPEQVYRDLKPIFDLMDEEERTAGEDARKFLVEQARRDREDYERQMRTGIRKDNVAAGIPKLRPSFKPSYSRTKRMIEENLGHESAFLFKTAAMDIEAAMKPENRSEKARIELVRAAVRETARGTREYSDYLKRKGGVYDGFRQVKGPETLNKVTNLMIRTSPHAVVKTLFDDPKLVHAACGSIRQMAESYRQTVMDRVLLWGGILVAGISIATVVGGLVAFAGGAGLVVASLTSATTATVANTLGIAVTSANLLNNAAKEQRLGLGEQDRVLAGSRPAVDRYTNAKVDSDLKDVRAQSEKLEGWLKNNGIDLLGYLAAPLLARAWDAIQAKYLKSAEGMFKVKAPEATRYVSFTDARGGVHYARLKGSTEDGKLVKLQLLDDETHIVITSDELRKWRIDESSRLRFAERFPTSSAAGGRPVKEIPEYDDAFSVKYQGESRYFQTEAAGGKIRSAKILGETEDGKFLKVRYLDESTPMVVPASQKTTWKMDRNSQHAASVNFHRDSPEALLDAKSLYSTGNGIIRRLGSLRQGSTLPTKVQVSPERRKKNKTGPKKHRSAGSVGSSG